MGMKKEVEAALEAHALWRERFKDILNGRAPFDLATINATNQCSLGKWLDSEGHRMIPSELHAEICVVHKEFHQIAADIIQMIKDKRYTEAKTAISLAGPLHQTSLHLRSLLVKLSFTKPAEEGKPSLLDEPAPAPQESDELLTPPVVESLRPKSED